MGDKERRLCTMKRRLRLERFPAQEGSNPGPLDQ